MSTNCQFVWGKGERRSNRQLTFQQVARVSLYLNPNLQVSAGCIFWWSVWRSASFGLVN